MESRNLLAARQDDTVLGKCNSMRCRVWRRHTVASLRVNVERNDFKFDVLCDLYDVISAAQSIIYCNSKNECNKIFKQIRSDMSKSIAGNKFKKKSYKHIDDKTGKSIGTIYYLNVNGGEISVEHMDWSKNVSWSDNVNVSIHTTEVLNWMRSDYGTK